MELKMTIGDSKYVGGTTVQEVIDDLLQAISDGCQSVGDQNGYPMLSVEAIAFFGRRYALSIKKKLKDSPHDWPNPSVLDLARRVGQIAGAMWMFWRNTAPGTHSTVDIDLLMKACHVMELECHNYLEKTLGKKDNRPDFYLLGGYCS
jgi:hypothetical protein